MPAPHGGSSGSSGSGGVGLARGLAVAFSTAASSAGGSKSRSHRSGGGSSKQWPFLTGIVLGAGVASLLHALWSIGGTRRSAGGSSYPFSFIAARDVVAVRGWVYVDLGQSIDRPLWVAMRDRTTESKSTN